MAELIIGFMIGMFACLALRPRQHLVVELRILNRDLEEIARSSRKEITPAEALCSDCKEHCASDCSCWCHGRSEVAP